MSQAQLIPTALQSSPTIIMHNSRPATTSLEVAKYFGKRHDAVLRDIRNLTDNCPEKFTAHNFVVSEYTDETGRTLVMFILYRDAFMLLVMGYTGKKAMQIKLVYIMAFNDMQEKLDKLAAEERARLDADVKPSALTPSTTADRRPLEKLIKVWASQATMPHAQGWTQVNAHFNLHSVTELPVEWLPDAIAFVERKIDALPKALPPAQQAPYVDRLQLTPWDKVQLGKQAVAILERGDKVGPRTLECILLKLRYLDAIQDVLRLGESLAADVNKMRVGVFGKIVQAGNASGCMTDPVMDILCDDTSRLQGLAREFELTAFRALNASICGAKMLGM